MDIGRLQIEGAIFHQIPAGSARAGDPGSLGRLVLTTSETELDERLTSFLLLSLGTTFDEAAQPVIPLSDEELEQDEIPTPEWMIDWLEGDDEDVVALSRPAAERLRDVQAPNSPEGVFAVVRGALAGERVLAMLKVEQERGLSIQVTELPGGEVTVEVTVEEGLMLTDKTTVFKAAVFRLGDDGGLRGHVTDDQTGDMLRKGPASHFWLRDFLGCRFARAADVQTREWLKAMETVVRTDLDLAEDKEAVSEALRSELRSNKKQINPEQFIQEHVPVERQDAARNRLQQRGAPVRTFTKSRDVSGALKAFKVYEWTNGVRVRLPDDVDADVKTQDLDGDPVDVMTIRGVLKSVT